MLVIEGVGVSGEVCVLYRYGILLFNTDERFEEGHSK